MQYNAGNTVFVAYIPTENIRVGKFPPQMDLPDKLPIPRVVERGNREGSSVARVVIRWEPLPFYLSRYYQEIVPALYRVIRRVYNRQGFLRRPLLNQVLAEELPEESPYIVEVGEEDSVGQIAPVWISKDKVAIHFPRKLECPFRPAVFVYYLQEPPRRIRVGGLLICKPYASLPETLREKEFQPLPYSEGKVIEAWENRKKDLYFHYAKVLFVHLPYFACSRKIRLSPSRSQEQKKIRPNTIGGRKIQLGG